MTTQTDRLAELQEECEYSETEDCSMDSLIDYKNALEEEWSRDAEALDRIADILRVPEGEDWPSGADFLEWVAEIITATGRNIEEA